METDILNFKPCGCFFGKAVDETLFSHPKEELSVAEQPFPDDRSLLCCEQQGFQVLWDDHNLTFPGWNKCWYVIKIKSVFSWAKHS